MAVLRKRIKWPRKRISKYYENAWKKYTKTHRKSLQKRIDLKIEDKQILCKKNQSRNSTTQQFFRSILGP